MSDDFPIPEEQAAQLEKQRFSAEEAFGLYKDTEAKLVERKRKLALFDRRLKDHKSWCDLREHRAFKALMEGASKTLEYRPVAPEDPGFQAYITHEAGRRAMLATFEATIAAECGDNPREGGPEQWKAQKAELNKEIERLEKLLADSKAAYDAIVAANLKAVK